MNTFFRSIVSFGRKHDNVLFAIGEIALGTAAVIFAVKNTAKYIEDHDNNEAEEESKTPVEKAKDLGAHYWQTGICLGGFIALRSLDCVYTGEQKREYSKALMACQAALAAKKPKDANKIAQNDSGDHPEGDEMIECRDEKAYDQYEYTFFFDADEMPDPEESVYLNDCCKRDAFYIPSTGRFFISTLQDVLNAEMSCRLQIGSGKRLYMNDMYKYLGIGHDGIGHDMYIEGDVTGKEDEFMFDLAPAVLEYNDGFESSDLMYTINPNKFIYDLNIPEIQ